MIQVAPSGGASLEKREDGGREGGEREKEVRKIRNKHGQKDVS